MAIGERPAAQSAGRSAHHDPHGQFRRCSQDDPADLRCRSRSASAFMPDCVGRFSDRVVALVTLIGTSLPEFVWGNLLIIIFAFWLKWLPPSSLMDPGDSVFSALQAADPAGADADAGDAGLHQPDDAHQHDRGAGAQFRPHRAVEGHRRAPGDPAPRPAQRAAADHHHRRDEHRLADGQPRGRRNRIQLSRASGG